MSEVVERVKDYVKEEFAKPEARRKSSYEHHFVIVANYAVKLAEIENADKEIVEIASWLHDIASIKGDDETHHISGAKIAEDLLKGMNYPAENIEKVKHCIFSHRASKNIKRETKEAKILADADSMAHFDSFGNILKTYEEEGLENPKKLVLQKLERSYAKLSENAKSLVKDKLEKARKELA